jgi:hypothetical protein
MAFCFRKIKKSLFNSLLAGNSMLGSDDESGLGTDAPQRPAAQGYGYESAPGKSSGLPITPVAHVLNRMEVQAE